MKTNTRVVLNEEAGKKEVQTISQDTNQGFSSPT